MNAYTDDDDICTCGRPLDDGEGWDGLCGECADRKEARWVAYLASAGCLPDAEPVEFQTAREAWDHVAHEVERYDDDAEYLEAHTALHLVDRDAGGSIPAGFGLYSWHVAGADR